VPINPKEVNLPPDRVVELMSNVLTKVPLPDGRIIIASPLVVAIVRLEERLAALENPPLEWEWGLRMPIANEEPK